MSQATPRFTTDDAPPGTPRRSLMGAIPALALFGTSAAVAGPKHPDAALIALCDKYLQAEVEWRRLLDIQFGIEASHGHRSAEHEAAYDLTSVAAEVRHDLIPQIADIPASTPDGWRAKARVFQAFHAPELPSDALVDCVLESLIEDMVGSAAI